MQNELPGFVFRPKLKGIALAIVLVLLCSVSGGYAVADNPLRVGVANKFLLAPALGSLEELSRSGVASVKQLQSSVALRDAFAANQVDMIIDSAQSLSLLPADILAKSSAIWDVAASYGSIGVITSPKGSEKFESVSDLDSVKVLADAASPAYYFALWLGDCMGYRRGGPEFAYRNSSIALDLVAGERYQAVVAEEPILSYLALRKPGGKVLTSTANYQPVIHYIALARDSAVKSMSTKMVALIEAVFQGQLELGSWAELLDHAWEKRGLTDADPYVFMKYTYFDKAYNIDVFFGGPSLGEQISVAAVSTHVHTGTIWQSDPKAAVSGFRLSDEVMSRVAIQGKTIEPDPRPWSGVREIMRFEDEIGFELASSEITPEGLRKLSGIADRIRTRHRGEIRIEVEGWADSIGTVDFNLRLSGNRANSVADFLIANLGLSARDVVGRGMGVGGDDPLHRRTIIRVFQKEVW
ncbi:MAG TPA: OmpA family protein [Bacillota bacterium]|jgi:outer membrane protein OmpA-like peptidoglycan-associated protein/ABC-type amino acid transport substrate-binding protein|nr:OmpA family protein [Bacillota bacterium]HPU74940.1 OmpA family protein [Bacillota bacterium]